MKKSSCDECGGNFNMQEFKDKIWNTQLQAKQILINGEITEDLIERAVIQIFNFNDIDEGNRLNIEERQPIIVYINSPGGLLDESFSLISAIESSKTPVITVALGKAYSAGFLVLLAGHKRFAQKYTSLMLHQGSAGVMGEFNRMIEYAKHWENCQSMIDDYVMDKTKIKKKKLEEIFKGKQDFYMSSKDAIQLGVIDGLWEEVDG